MAMSRAMIRDIVRGNPQSSVAVLGLSLLGGLVQIGKLSVIEACMSIMAAAAVRGVFLMSKLLWWVENISDNSDDVSARLSYIEKRDMYRYCQGHELVRMIRTWFFSYKPEVSGIYWFIDKLALEVSLWRQAVEVRGFTQSLAVVCKA